VKASDACGPLQWRIRLVRSSESVSRFDWVIAPGGQLVILRAACSNPAQDRIYTIMVEVTDAAGNKTEGTTTVRVRAQPSRR
jgi:hypothetical protein